jgi:hypothetical protein
MGNNGEIYITGTGYDSANFDDISIIEEGSFSFLAQIDDEIIGIAEAGVENKLLI